MPIDYQRLYAYRFRDVDQAGRLAVWREVALHVHTVLGSPQRVLDPAAGRGEFIGQVPAAERWAVDRVLYEELGETDSAHWIAGDILDAELPREHFDGVFVSNFLEHLATQDDVGTFLQKMHGVTCAGGRIAVMGPNFRYCADEYFDCADHTLIFTHVSVAEHLYAAGFEIERVIARYLPYSFRGRLPPSAALTRRYLRTPALWRVLGKQFLVIGRRR